MEQRAAERDLGASPAGSRLGWRAGLALFTGALALRLFHLFEISGSTLASQLLGDALAYEVWARRIAAGDLVGDGVFYQSPVYPYFLATVHRLVGAEPSATRGIQALLGAAACLLIARAGSGFFGRRAGWVAGALVAAYPPAIFFDGEIQKASLSLFLAAALLAMLPGLRDRPTLGRSVLAGSIAGLFALHRENAMLLVPALAGWLLWLPGRGVHRRTVSRRVATAAALIAGVGLVLLPVALRNLSVGGEFVLTTSQLGTNFYIGNNPGADGRYRPLRPGRGSAHFEREDARALAEASLGRTLGAREVSRYWLGRGLEFARREPARWLALLGRKVRLTWSRRELVDTVSFEAVADDSRALRWIEPTWNFGMLFPLAAAGIWWTRRQRRDVVVLHLWLVTWTLSVAAFFVLARYRYPLVPVLALFAGAAIDQAVERVKRRQWRSFAAPIVLAIAAAAFARTTVDDRDPRAVTWASLGNALGDAGRESEGERWLAAAVEASPRFAEAHLSLGHLQLARDALGAAELSYRRVTELDPSKAEAWNNLGVIALRQERRAEAIERFRRATRADPAYARARYNLGRALLEGGELASAHDELQRLVALAPADAEGQRLLANLLAHRGDLAGARVAYDRALALDPRDADARFKLALVLHRSGESAAAVDQLRRALELEPRYADRLDLLAREHDAAGRAVEAENLRALVGAARGGPRP